MATFLIGFAFGAVIGGLVAYILEVRHQIRFLGGLKESTRNEMRRMTDFRP